VPGELANVTTADAYTPGTTATHAPADRLRLYVRNASIAYQLGYGTPPDFGKYAERPLPPGDRSYDEAQEPFTGVRVRSLTPGAPAQVIADCVPVGGGGDG
jgi:hypothetical protein